MSDAVFSRRVAVTLGLVAAASFIGSIVFGMLGAEVREESSHQADTFSRSAIGHHALVTLLRRLVPVVVSRSATSERAGADTALLLLEPRLEADDPTAKDLPDLIRESRAGVVIVVLPKWRTGPIPAPGGFVRQVRPAHDAEEVLRALEVFARVRAAEGPWQAGADFGAPELPVRPQVIEGGALNPLISDGAGGVLVGEVETLGRSVVVIADADLVNNAGLLTGRNAEVVVALLAHVVGHRTVMIDETLHGFTVPEGVWPQLFRFPLVLATLQVGLVLVLVVWAGMRRFGAPVPLASALGRGRRVLVENTARILWFGGHSQDALARYWADTLRAVAERLHAPPLDPQATRAWLDAIGHSRQVPETTTEIDAAVITAAGDGDRILAAARRIQQWRVRMVE